MRTWGKWRNKVVFACEIHYSLRIWHWLPPNVQTTQFCTASAHLFGRLLCKALFGFEVQVGHHILDLQRNVHRMQMLMRRQGGQPRASTACLPALASSH